jgi:hypothetical protein
MMNKGKIAELYKQAHREHRQEYFSSDIDPTVKSVSVTRYFDHELFAELIVKECIETVAENMYSGSIPSDFSDGADFAYGSTPSDFSDGADFAYAQAISDIKQHFGVE